MRFLFKLVALAPTVWLAAPYADCSEAEPVDRESLIDWIRTWQNPAERIPLEAVVEGLSGCRVLDW